MDSLENEQFKRYILELVEQHKHQRVYFFEYGSQSFWLKQPEQLKGIWRWLKPNSQQTLKKEIKSLQDLHQKTVLVPELVYFDETFLVLKDAGQTVNHWVNDHKVSAVKKQEILNDSAKALANLHQLKLSHGRPALRDIAWNNGNVKFIDFETTSHCSSLQWKQIRDLGIFIHAMFRERQLDIQQIDQAVIQYRRAGGELIWLHLIRFMQKAKILYFVLFLFKPIARTDLIAILELSDYLLKASKKRKNK